MKPETVDLIKYRIEKAKTTLNDAKKYFSDVSLESTVNRIYYAMFYSVNALLISKDMYSSKHSGVRGLFNKEFVNKGLIETRLGKFYSDMFDNRQEGDYRDFVSFNKDNVGAWITKADEFIAEIEKLLPDEV